MTDPSAPSAIGATDATGRFAWYRSLSPQGRRAFAGAFGGYGLDSYDFQVLPLALTAVAAYFRLSTGQAGLLTTVTLVLSAVGGVLAGLLVDRIGRVRTLMITVGGYAVFTMLCGFAVDYPMLLVFRSLQGLGFGGEWAAGAILVAEYASARYRGRTVAFIQAAWSVGWGLAVLVATVVLSRVNDGLSWRILFWTGALPGLLLLYLRRGVADAPIPRAPRESTSGTPVSAVFRGALLRRTLFATLLATGVQGGYYTIATWLPTYLRTVRHLTVVGTGGYLFLLITGAFTGYVVGGYATDAIGRRKAIALFGVLSSAILFTYIHIPVHADRTLFLLGFPLGFCSSAIFSGFGSYLAELYPTAVRGTGQGFSYNVGRAIGAFFPTAVGFQAGSRGMGNALAYGAVGYAIAMVALLGLPETRGSDLHLRHRSEVRTRPELDDDVLHRTIVTVCPARRTRRVGVERSHAWVPVADLLSDTGTDWDRRVHRISALAHALPVKLVDAWVAKEPEHQDALTVRAYSRVVHADKTAGRSAVRRAHDACMAAAATNPRDPTPWIAQLALLRAHRSRVDLDAVWNEVMARDPWNRAAHYEMLRYLSPRVCGVSPFEMKDFADHCAHNAPLGSPLAVLPLAARAENYAHRVGALGPDAIGLSGYWYGPTVTGELDFALHRWFHTNARPHAQAMSDLNILAFALTMTRRTQEAAPVFRRIGHHMTAFPWDTLSDPVGVFEFWSDRASV